MMGEKGIKVDEYDNHKDNTVMKGILCLQTLIMMKKQKFTIHVNSEISKMLSAERMSSNLPTKLVLPTELQLQQNTNF